MKAIVNNTPVSRWGDDEHNIKGITETANYELIFSIVNRLFIKLIYAVTESTTESGLRENMKWLNDVRPDFKEYFLYGFGANHMWVKQIDDEGSCHPNDIVIVNF